MTATVVSPAPVWDVINGYAAYGALCAAVELGLFDALDGSASGADQLAAAVGAKDPDQVALLADTLVSLGFLTTDGGRYGLGPVAERFLVSTSAHDMTALVRLSPGPRQAWVELADTVRRGASRVSVDEDPGAFYPGLVEATAPTQRAVAAPVVAHLDRAGLLPEAPTVVDLGAGSAAWALAFLTARPAATALAVDLPEVVGTTARLGAGFGDRLTVLAGDYLDVELPQHTDVVVLGHVLRAEPADRARSLLHRALGLVGPDGVVVVADYPRPSPADGGDPDRDAVLAGARHELLLSLTMLAATGGHGVTSHQLETWAAEVGASVVERLEPLPRQHVLLIRPAASTGPGPAKEIRA